MVVVDWDTIIMPAIWKRFEVLVIEDIMFAVEGKNMVILVADIGGGGMPQQKGQRWQTSK